MHRQRLRITILLALLLFLVGASASAVAPFRAVVGIEALGLSNPAFAALMIVNSVAGAVVSVILGAMSDHVRDRRMLVLCCALAGVAGFGAIYAVPTKFAFMLAFVLIIPFGTVLFSQSFSYARTYYDEVGPARSKFMLSVLRSFFTLAWIVVPPVVGWLATRASALSVFGLASLSYVLAAVVAVFLLVDPAARVASPATAGAGARRGIGATLAAIAGIAADRKVGIAGVALVRTSIFLTLMAMPLLILNDLHGSAADIGYAFSIGALLEAPLMIAWGYAGLRLSQDTIIVITGLIYTLYLALMSTSGSVTTIFWLQGLNGVAIAALVSVTISYMQDAISGRVGLSTSLLDLITVLATSLASGLFGLFSSAGHYATAVGAGAVVCLVGTGLVGLSRAMRRAVAA